MKTRAGAQSHRFNPHHGPDGKFASGGFSGRFEECAKGQDALDEAGGQCHPNGDGTGTMTAAKAEKWTAEESARHFDDFHHGYGNGDYSSINESLRGHADPETTAKVSAHIARMDAVYEVSPLAGDVGVYRGMGNSAVFGVHFDGDLTGFAWREDAYMSTSASESTARGFAYSADGRGVLMRLIIPKGTGSVNMHNSESELLLMRGLSLRVVADHGMRVDKFGDTHRLLDVEASV